jgi:multidrug efflux system outer membrane protein
MILSRCSLQGTPLTRRCSSGGPVTAMALAGTAGIITSLVLTPLAHAQKQAPAAATAPTPAAGSTPPVVSPARPNSPASPSAPLSTPTPQNEPPIPIPPPPNVNDPMLAPVAEPEKKIATWEQAMQLLKSRSTSLQTSFDEVLRSEAQARLALSNVLPQINGQLNYTHQLLERTTTIQETGANLQNPTTGTFISLQSTQPQPNIGSAALSAQWPLLNVENWQQYGTAKYQIDVNKLNFANVKRTITQTAASDLVSVVTAERVAELNRVALRNSLELLDLTQRKTNLGSGTGLDVIRAQQTVETARATLVTGDESLRQAREALGLALGIPEQVGVEKSLNLNGLEQSAMDTCHPAKSLDERADIASDKATVHVAKRNIDNVWLQFLPSGSINSNVTTSTQQGSVLPPVQWNIQGVLTIPIWDGGNKYYQLRNARALEDEAQQTLESDRRAATVQITQAQRNVSVAEKSREVAGNARQLAAENDRLTRVGYIEGKYTSNDLVLSTDALRQAEIQLAVQEFGVVQAKVAAILALSTCNY